MLLACGGGTDQADTADTGLDIADVGFMTPESVLHDPVADVYLVSNINGAPLADDDNGFISRVTPDGQVENLHWISGADPTMLLHAPKGMAIRGDTLFVADITCIRMFHRVTGAAAGVLCLDGVTFLNDIAVGPEGSIFVTDTGMEDDGTGNLTPSGTDAIYRYPVREGLQGSTIAKNPDLGGPNGIAVGSRGIFVVTFRTGEIMALNASGERTRVLPPSPGRQLDGIVFLPDGGFMYSNWADSTVYRVGADGAVTRVARGVPAPADIGFDATRNRVLIPLFNDNRVVIRDVGNE
jgi:hypothetical protein